VGVKGLAGISDMIETGHLLEESLPELAGELKLLLATAGEEELASQISSLRLIDRCRCDDSFCATGTVLHVQRVLGTTTQNDLLKPER